MAVALDVLADQGPASTTHHSMVAVARELGMSRAALYRLWPSAADLDVDLTVFLATSWPGWARRLLEQSPEDGVRAALVAALDGHVVDPGVVARASSACWPDDTAARDLVARHELGTIEELGAWLADADPGRTDVAWVDVAIALYAFVEGRLFLAAIRRPGSSDADAVELVDEVSATAARLVHELSRMATGPAAPISQAAEVAAPDRSAEQLRVLGELAGRPAAGATAAPSRLVDVEQLATLLGVSSRRVHAMWPTATDLNADLVTSSLGALRARIEDLTLQTFTAAMGGYDKFVGLFESTFQAILAGSSTAARAWFGCTSALGDERIRAEAARLFDEWYQAQQLSLFAALQVIGYRLRPPGDGGRYVESVFATVNGALRLSVLHPSLLDRSVNYDGHLRGSLPSAIDAMFRSFTEPMDIDAAGTDGGGTWAPPLPDQA